ncbi:MAG: GTP 3',8-cyclase MoaA [Eubacterium sp.]|nr:GTP 3',8-cyclase MoaA [Eubacterium sp.]
MKDGYNREIDYVRVSVTDKCNLRCRYCMPQDIEHVPMSEILTFEEICFVIKCMAALGIKKVKITGGEPLVRRDVSILIKNIKNINGIEKVTLTTNGILLADKLEELKEAGIDGINISLDTLDSKRYAEITGYSMLDKVLEGIDCALASGITCRLNTVSIDSSFYDKSVDMLKDTFLLMDYIKDKKIDLRFIELMPIGFARGFPAVSHETLLSAFKEKYPEMIRTPEYSGNGPAVYYKIPGFMGNIGFISAMHGKFCDSCNRIRLTTKGFLKSCLCYDTGEDIRSIIREDISMSEKEANVTKIIAKAIYNKPENHCFTEEENITEKHTMASIGG